MCDTCASLGIPRRCSDCSTPICLQPDPELAGTSLQQDLALATPAGAWVCADCLFFDELDAIADRMADAILPPRSPQLRLVV